ESNDLAATNSLLTAIASRAVAGKRLTSSAMASAAKSAGHGDFGITASEMSKLGERLKKGHSAIIIVVENVWERKLREIAHKDRGGLSRQILVDSATLAGVAKRIGTSSRRASRRTLGRTQPKIRVA